MREVLEALNHLVADEVVTAYAIGGAIGAAFYIKAAQTEDRADRRRVHVKRILEQQAVDLARLASLVGRFKLENAAVSGVPRTYGEARNMTEEEQKLEIKNGQKPRWTCICAQRRGRRRWSRFDG